MAKFSEWLAEFGGGALDDELTAQLTEVTEASSMLGLKGGLTIKVEVIPESGGIIARVDTTAKVPKHPRAGFFYRDERDGGLSRRDPNQPEIPYQEQGVQE